MELGTLHAFGVAVLSPASGDGAGRAASDRLRSGDSRPGVSRAGRLDGREGIWLPASLVWGSSVYGLCIAAPGPAHTLDACSTLGHRDVGCALRAFQHRPRSREGRWANVHADFRGMLGADFPKRVFQSLGKASPPG